MPPYEELVAAARAAPVQGWDFGWLAGRAEGSDPSWSYPDLARALIARSERVLDVDTGGGELLALGGVLVTQQVGSGDCAELNAALGAPRAHPPGSWTLAVAGAASTAAGLRLLGAREEHPAVTFLLHVPRQQTAGVLATWRGLLRAGGTLALTTSLGPGEGWEAVPYQPDSRHQGPTSRRWFAHHQRPVPEGLLREAGFRLQGTDVRDGHRQWLQVLATPPADRLSDDDRLLVTGPYTPTTGPLLSRAAAQRPAGDPRAGRRGARLRSAVGAGSPGVPGSGA